MHGIARVRTTEEERIRKEKERQIKLKLYQKQLEVVFKKRTTNEYDEEALKITGELLCSNPDFSTLWNYRREVLISLQSRESENDAESKVDQMQEHFNTELRLTENCLKVNPKSYYAWFHRVWILEKMNDPNWNAEIDLCSKYLKYDERNFHCWDYRNFLVNKAKVDLGKEFEFTTIKIQENFSNYSAWHYRSKLLPELFPDCKKTNVIEENKHREELELVINAAFTDPNDTSAWFYQRWLLGTHNRDIALATCRISKERCYITFNQNVSLNDSTFNVIIEIDDNVVEGKWKSLSGFKYDVFWIFAYEKTVDFSTNKNTKVILKNQNAEEQVIICDFAEENDRIGYANVSFSKNFGKSVVDELKQQQQSCEQLMELEPDSKWTHLTLAVILNTISHISNYNICVQLLEKLVVLDPKRTYYYKDLFSRWHLECIIENHVNIVEQGNFLMENLKNHSFKITRLYHLQYWSACRNINLRGQELTVKSLPSLIVLQNCQILDIGGNSIDSLKGFPALPKLHTIYLDGNNVDKDNIRYLKNCPLLENIFLNETTKVDEWKTIIPSLKTINICS